MSLQHADGLTLQQAIAQVADGEDLARNDMQSIMRTILTGHATDAQIAGLLVALRIKGETVEEITAAAEVMISLANKVQIDKPYLIDIVGTGGDGSGTFNISTVSSFVAAGAGATVAKHGNRSVSSQSGSADLLEQAGANLNLTPAQVAQVIDVAGVGFMFAVRHHSAMKHAIGPRKEMALRTIFNVLGPLTNPAQVKRHVVGVYDLKLVNTLAQVLKHLGGEHALVVHSDDGMDEISICAATSVSELKGRQVIDYRIDPTDFGLRKANVNDIVVSDAVASLAMMDGVLAGKQSPARDIVLLNAGAGIYVAGIADSLKHGVELAASSIDSGKALAASQRYVSATQTCSKS